MSKRPTYEELEQRVRELEKNDFGHKRTEEGLLENRQILAGLVENSGTIIVIKDCEGKYLLVNRKWEDVTGFKRESIIGKTDETLFPGKTGRQFRENDLRVIASESIVEMEEFLETPSGTRYFISNKFPLTGDDGTVTGLCGIITDITERKQAEMQLQRNERLLNDTQQLAKIGGWEMDLEKQITFWTNEVYRIHDLNPDRFTSLENNTVDRSRAGQSDEFTSVDEAVRLSLKCYDPEDRPVVINAFKKCAEEGRAYDLEFPFTTTKGRRIWVRTKTSPVIKNGKVVKIVGNLMDITEAKLAEEAIKRNESMQWKMVANIGDVIAIIDKDGINRYKSPNIEKLFGWKPEDVVGASTWNNVHPDDVESMHHFFETLTIEPNAVGTAECRYKCRDGSYRWIEFKGSNLLHDPDINGILGNYHDITNRKQVEQSLLESETRFKSLHNASFGGIAIHDKGVILECNQGLSEMTGYSMDELIGMDGLLLIDEKSRPAVLHRIKTGYEKPYEAIGLRKNGETFPMRLEARNIPYKGKNVRTVEFRDITDRKRADKALRESEEKFRALVEKSPLGISLIGQDGRYRYLNPQFTHIFGYTIEDTPTGKAWFKRAYPDEEYRKKVMKAWRKDLKKAKMGQSRPHIAEVTCKDGSRKDINFRPVTMETGDQFVVYEDITEKLKMEQQLRQAQKFEAIGTLAGGIAHDFNNLLMGIQGRTSLMSVDLEPSHSHLEHLSAIEDYIRNATDLTKQLLGLARGGKYEVKPTDINELVHKSANMFGRANKKLRIQTKFKIPSPVVSVDKRQIEQVLLNLYINAWQAMPDGGELYLATRVVSLDEAFTKPYNATPGTHVQVSVKDTGIGMDAATQQQIFDPFFTTKDKGRGTGLGLASAYGIIKNHEGIILVNSKIGHGTTFHIYLPMSDEEAYPDAPMAGRLLKGSETVLLVDDEEMILEVGQAMLKKLGYRIIVADSGRQALDVVDSKGDDIDMVILDLIMPGMDGGKVFERIKEIRPQLPVMLSSGYAINGQADDIMKKGCNGFIQKPFNLSELSQKLRQILNTTKK
jgi:two-component system, cell cycle sensor histidine kinase and response regulator CckA